MYCCDTIDTVLTQQLKTAVIHRPQNANKKPKGFSQTPKYSIQTAKSKNSFFNKRYSHATVLESVKGLIDKKCITQMQFYQSKNKQDKSKNSSLIVSKPYIPQKSLKLSKQTQITQKINKPFSSSYQISKRSRFFLQSESKFQTQYFKKQKINAQQSLKIRQSEHLQNTAPNHYNFNTSNSPFSNLINQIQLTQSQTMVVKQQQSHNKNIRLQQSEVEQHSILNNFYLIKKRQNSQHLQEYIGIDKFLNLVLSIKIIDIEKINGIYNETILCQMLCDSNNILQLYQSVVNKNRQYIFIREYFEDYLSNITLTQTEVYEYLKQIIQIIEQMILRKIKHLKFYECLVKISDKVKLSNFQFSESQNLQTQCLTQYYQQLFKIVAKKIIKQTKISNSDLKYIQYIVCNSNMAFQNIKLEILNQIK